MRHRFIFNFERISHAYRGSSDSQVNDGVSAYARLSSIISDLQRSATGFRVVVEVTDNMPGTGRVDFDPKIRGILESLSRRELQVFYLAIDGVTTREIAEKLSISFDTVKTHRKNIVSKAGVRNIGEMKTWLLKGIRPG